MTKIGVHQLNVTGARDGTRFLRDDGTWATPAGGGGGGGTSGGRDRRWTPGPAETSIDEFNDDSLDAAWVRVDAAGAAGRVTWTEAADVVAFLNTGGDAASELHGLMRPLSGVGGSMVAGNAFITAANLPGASSGNSFSGIIVSDGVAFGSGNQMAITRHQTGQTYLRRFTGWNANPAAPGIGTFQNSPLYMRLVYLGGTTWRGDYSAEGVAWGIGPTLAAVAGFTPTHIGVISSSWGGGSGSNDICSYELIRRVSGIV